MTSQRKHWRLLIAGWLGRNSDQTLVDGCVYVGIPGRDPSQVLGITRNGEGGYLFERLPSIN